MLQTAIQLVGSQAICIWSATLEEEQRALFDAAGFKLVEWAVTKNPQAALVRPVRDEMLNQEWLVGRQRLLDLRNWDLRMIYSEGF